VTWRAFTSHVDVLRFRKILKQISKTTLTTRKFLLTLKLSSAPDVQRLRSQGRDPAIPVIPPGPGRSPAVFTNPAIRSFIMAKKGGSKGTSAAVRSAKDKRGNGAQKLKQKKK
jgi:hypothetical protein